MRPHLDAPRLLVSRPRPVLIDLCAARGWPLLTVFFEDRDNHHPQTLVFDVEGRDTRVYWVDDYIVDMPYVVVEGTHADEIAEELRSDLGVPSDEDVFERWDTADDEEESVFAMFYLGISAPPSSSPQHLARFDAGLQSDSRFVRLATLTAMGYRAWPELLPLAQRACDDLDPEVAEVAQRLVARLRADDSSSPRG